MSSIRLILIIACIILPVLIVLNAMWATRRRNLGREDRAQGIAGSIMMALFVVSVASFFLGVGEAEEDDFSGHEKEVLSSPPPIENYTPGKWSLAAVTESQKTVKSLLEKKLLKIDRETNKAYLSPSLWAISSLDEKKEIMMSIIIYADNEIQGENKYFDFYNLQSGKQIASWSKTSDFNFEY